MATLIHTFRSHAKDVNCVGFSPADNVLASSSGDKTTYLWNVETGKEHFLSPLIGHNYAVTYCKFSPCGAILATASQDQNIILWDSTTGNQLKTLQGHKGIVRCCVFSSNSLYLASASSDETIKVWNLENYDLVRVLRGPEFSLMTCAFTPDDLYIVSGSVYGDIRIWDFSSGKCEDMMQAHDSGLSGVGITGCSFSPSYGAADKQSLNRSGESPCFLLATCGGDNLIKLWDVYTASAYSHNCSFKANGILEGHSGHVWDCKFSSDGAILVSCSSDKTIILWNPLLKTIISKLAGHSRYITTVDISKDKNYIASGSNDKTVQVWLLDTTVSESEREPCVTPQTAQNQPPMKLMRDWSVEDVCVWLNELGLSQYCETFRINAIDGAELMRIKDEILSAFLGVGPLGHRNKILREVKLIREKEVEGNIPDEFLCPITRELMSDPVIAADGFTYEHESIRAWILSGKDTSPMTNIPLQHTNLIPNRSLKSAILRYFGPAPLEFPL